MSSTFIQCSLATYSGTDVNVNRYEEATYQGKKRNVALLHASQLYKGTV